MRPVPVIDTAAGVRSPEPARVHRRGLGVRPDGPVLRRGAVAGRHPHRPAPHVPADRRHPRAARRPHRRVHLPQPGRGAGRDDRRHRHPPAVAPATGLPGNPVAAGGVPVLVGGTRPRTSRVEQRQRPDRSPAAAATPAPPPGPAGTRRTAATGCRRGVRGQVEQRVQVPHGSPSAITAASTAANPAGERSVAARSAAWIARDAPALPRTSTRPGRGPTARPRATACRMFSDWVPTRRCPGAARQHNRTSQSCSTVAPAGIGPYPSRAPT